ncbi:MAG TPA: hypothetical protein VFK41_03240 [Nocardioidaceae bacterium]|nr:hypothetical protein [Nocardioidaceae bacterium]
MNPHFRLPGRSTSQRVASAVAVFAVFYLVLFALSLLSNSWLATGESFVTP